MASDKFQFFFVFRVMGRLGSEVQATFGWQYFVTRIDAGLLPFYTFPKALLSITDHVKFIANVIIL